MLPSIKEIESSEDIQLTNVLIIGATGTIGRAATQMLAETTTDQLTLFSRHASRLNTTGNQRVVQGNIMNDADLDGAMKGQDAVLVAVSGNLGQFAKRVIASMKRENASRLLFITAMGIYDEVPASVGSNSNLMFQPGLQTYRDAADAIEQSDLNYTVIRPGWFTSGPIDYEVTEKGKPFGGHDISVSSIADLIKRLIEDDNLYSRGSVGINTPTR